MAVGTTFSESSCSTSSGFPKDARDEITDAAKFWGNERNSVVSCGCYKCVCVCVCVCISALLLVRFEGYLLASAFFKLDVQGLSLGCNPAA
jgi:hypothetical protein